MAKQSYKMKFELIGNAADGPKVKKTNPNYGDGEIGTGKGGMLYANLSATLKLVENNSRVKFSVTYKVYEDEYGKKKNEDSLQISKDYFWDVSSFTQVEPTSRIQGNMRITTKVSKIKLLTPEKTPKTPVAVDSTLTISSNIERHKEINWLVYQEQPWLPFKDVFFKVDGKGKELEKEGNLSIRGYVYFDIERVETETKEVIYIETASGTPTLEYGRGEEFKVKTTESTDKVETTVKTGADGKVVETTVKTESTNKTGGEQDPIPAVIKPVLGCGYDITSVSPCVSGCKYRVLDLNNLNKYRRIISTDNYNESENHVYQGESFSQYTKDIENKYGLSLSSNIFGATFSTEVNITFTEKTDKKQVSKYAKKDCKFIYNTYRVDEVSKINKLHPFLSETFLKDLDDMNPTEFIKNYGTHVVLGMKVGGRFTYNMRYTENLESTSKSEKIDHTISVGYSSSGKPDTKPSEKKLAAIDYLYSLLTNPDTSANAYGGIASAIKALEGEKSQSSTPTSGGSGNSGWGFSVTATSSNYEQISCTNEDKITEITCHSVGGDPAYVGAVMEDASKLIEWSKTVSANKSFIDFIPDTIIAIEEFIPAGHKLTKALVKEASETYMKDKKLLTAEPEVKEGTIDFNTQGKANTITKNTQDAEVDSKKDKVTGWEVYLQLVSFSDGFIGCTIALGVHEGGLNTGNTFLQNTQEVKFPKGAYSQMVIANETQTYHVKGSVKGKLHDWIDVTEQFQACEFLDTYGENVYIKIDDGGGDLGNVGIKGRLKYKYKAC